MSTTVEFRSLTKHWGDTHAVTDLSFTVQPGRVTGFLGPNGSGKSTSMRCLTGLIAPTSGEALINGEKYADLHNPKLNVGAALDAGAFHPGLTGYGNLAVIADAVGLDGTEIERCLKAVDMFEFRNRRVGAYSMGMKQRLSLAAALLGGPELLLLDEPANGLDPEGIAWMRSFIQQHAAQGGTVLISSHVLSEVQQTVDDVVIIANGRLVRACSLEELVAETKLHVTVTTPDTARFEAALREGIEGQRPTAIRHHNHSVLIVEGLPIALVGRLALQHNIELHGLTENRTDLEDVFLQLTGSTS